MDAVEFTSHGRSGRPGLGFSDADEEEGDLLHCPSSQVRQYFFH